LRELPMPGTKLGSQAHKFLAEGIVGLLRPSMDLTRFGHSCLLGSDRIACFRQFLLGAVPVITIPLSKDHFQLRLGPRVFQRALCLTLQAAQTRLQLGHDVLYTLKIACRAFESFQSILTADPVEPHACSLLEKAP